MYPHWIWCFLNTELGGSTNRLSKTSIQSNIAYSSQCAIHSHVPIIVNVPLRVVLPVIVSVPPTETLIDVSTFFWSISIKWFWNTTGQSCLLCHYRMFWHAWLQEVLSTWNNKPSTCTQTCYNSTKILIFIRRPQMRTHQGQLFPEEQCQWYLLFLLELNFLVKS